ncbi:MAG: thiamine-phosphate kinase [Betaproteobacteria bacterium]|nr:MAG: thiamine-phosphate kinase [Betaproteobacteria bacterium]
MPSEFELIARYFTRPVKRAVLGVGDDAALLRVGKGMEIAVSTDMLVCGTHFVAGADPRKLGHKSLAVNLSDMAAMAAVPRSVFLSLALPKAEPAWLRAFSAGFLALARAHGAELVGGDTTRGPLNICVTIMGEVPRGRALRRDHARAGDDVWVSGALGTAAIGLAHQQGRVQLSRAEAARCMRALEQPQPRVELGIALRSIAHAAIDVSDGLAADLGHICERSSLGADVWIDRIPRARVLGRLAQPEIVEQALIAGGDDYELCFTAPVRRRADVAALSRRLRLPLTRIGAMRSGRGVRLLRADGRAIQQRKGGWDHFG